jgi:hypothetical protein
VIRNAFNLMAAGSFIVFIRAESYFRLFLLLQLVGYAALAWGALQARHLTPRFQIVSALNALLLLLTATVIAASSAEWTDSTSAVILAVGAIQIIAFWMLAGAVVRSAKANLFPALAAQATRAQRMLEGVFGVILITQTVAAVIISGLEPILGFLPILLFLLMGVVFFLLLREAANTLGEPPTTALPLVVDEPVTPALP